MFCSYRIWTSLCWYIDIGNCNTVHPSFTVWDIHISFGHGLIRMGGEMQSAYGNCADFISLCLSVLTIVRIKQESSEE